MDKFKKKLQKLRNLKKKSFILIVLSILIIVFVAVIFISRVGKVWGEQSGGSPGSGATSRIKAIYDSLVTLGLGSESAGSWGDWGAYWNRIRSAAETSANYLAQSLEEYDDYKYGGSHGAGEGGGEESSWTNTATNVYKDNRTGLYWSNNLGSYTNLFNTDHSLCDFFAANPRGNYDGSDPDCGNAINACATLSKEAVAGQGAVSDWYLPSQKQLMQAYIDGIYNNTNTTWVTTSLSWSASEGSASSGNAWCHNLNDGYANNYGKGNSYSVRCVR
jgi:hypothetical protein